MILSIPSEKKPLKVHDEPIGSGATSEAYPAGDDGSAESAEYTVLQAIDSSEAKSLQKEHQTLPPALRALTLHVAVKIAIFIFKNTQGNPLYLRLIKTLKAPLKRHVDLNFLSTP